MKREEEKREGQKKGERDRGKEFSHRKKMDELKQVEGRCRNNDEKRRQGVGTG